MNRSIRVRSGRALALVVSAGAAIAAVHVGCGGSSDTVTGGTGGTAGGAGGAGAGTTSSPPGSGGTGGGIGGFGTGGVGGGTGGTGGGSGGAGGGTGGIGGGGGFGGNNPWPDCTTQPASAPTKTIREIWSDDDSPTPTEVWVNSAYVTAVSKDGCTAGDACQIYLQQDLGYATIDAARHHGIKLFASKNTATHFTGVKVGDAINVYGHAWRYNVDGENELLIQVSLHLPGCFAPVSSGNALTPIPLTELSDVTAEDYEQVGPLFVDVVATPKLHGKPAMPAETFGIFDSSVNGEAGVDHLISMSPFFLAGSVFTGLPTDGATVVHFDHATGVYGLFVPPMQSPPVTKYKELYVRATADYSPHAP